MACATIIIHIFIYTFKPNIMFKKFLSGLSVVALFAMLVPSTVLAADEDGFITTVDLTVTASDPTTFYPTGGEGLDVEVTFDTTAFPALLTSTGYVRVMSGLIVIKEIETIVSGDITVPTFTTSWDGIAVDLTGEAVCGSLGAPCPAGDYTLDVYVTDATDDDLDTAAFNIIDFAINHDPYNPAPTGGDGNFEVSYEYPATIDSVNVKIQDAFGDIQEDNGRVGAASGTMTWDGLFGTKLVEPGTYTAIVEAKDGGVIVDTRTLDFEIDYGTAVGVPDITGLTVDPVAFDPDYTSTNITFTNITDVEDIDVEIRDASNTLYREFGTYDGNSDDYSDGDTHDFDWNGKDKDVDGTDVLLGDYLITVVARNNYGVVKKQLTVTVDNNGSSQTSNDHINDLDFSPSNTFEPAEDDELEINFDIVIDSDDELDTLEIYAVKSGEDDVLIDDDSNVDRQTNYEVTWDGTDDDDDYVVKGTWRIEIRTTMGTRDLVASDTIDIEYEEPQIDELYLSKDEIDPDEDEFTYVIFKIDNGDAEVDVNVLEGGDFDDDLVEDWEVEEGKWYAIEWDGDRYDEDDDLDLEVKAKNVANDEVFNSDDIGIKVEENEVSSSKAKVNRDYISPVIAERGTTMKLYYDLEDKADVKVTIHEGDSGQGSDVIELIDIEDQAAGDHIITWNGRDEDSALLDDDEVYSYKIVTRDGSSETEIGVFVIGDVGEIDGSADGDDDDDDDNDDDNGGGTNNGVVVDDDNDPNDDIDGCGGFSDVSVNSPYCEAIEWAEENNVFDGYSDGTYKPYQSINRAEVLKVILEAVDVNLLTYPGGTFGFSDLINNEWYMPYVYTAYMKDIFDGDAGKSTARPGDPVNRVEVLKFVFETLNEETGYTTSSCSSSYGDIPAGAWYKNYACESKKYSLYDTGSFGNLTPGAYANRGEVAEVLYRLSQAGLL